jgi:hypothetical protein
MSTETMPPSEELEIIRCECIELRRGADVIVERMARSICEDDDNDDDNDLETLDDLRVAWMMVGNMLATRGARMRSLFSRELTSPDFSGMTTL